MKKFFLVFLLFYCFAAYSQKYPATYFFADSLLSNKPFQHIDTSSQITTGILWDRAYPNIYLPAYHNK